MQAKFARSFIYTAGGILLAMGLIRFLIVASAPFLPLRDPLLGISTFIVILIVGGVELIAALLCLFDRQVGLQAGLLAWLATNFLAYQVGLFWSGYPLKYGCLGSLTDPLHLSHGAVGFIMGLIPIYLLLGSYGVFIWLWFTKEGREAQHVAAMSSDQRDTFAGLLKMSCPACGGHIKFDGQNMGQQIPCPHCQKNTTLCKSGPLKMACFFCQGHIEFPPHAIGEKMPCPHCKMDITLKEPA